MTIKYSLLTVLGVILSLPSLVNADDNGTKSNVNNELNYYCATDGYSSQQRIKIGKAVIIYSGQGGMKQIEQQQGYSDLMPYLSHALNESGISEKCTEYLVNKSMVDTITKPEILARVYFNWDKANLTPDSKYILDSIVKKLSNNTEQFTVEGHTDNTGSNDYNMTLGLNRSESVIAYLEKRGIDPDTLKAKTQGEAIPIMSNFTADGRKKNRRVEIK